MSTSPEQETTSRKRRLGALAGAAGVIVAAVASPAAPVAAGNFGSTPPAGNPQNGVSLGGGASPGIHDVSFQGNTSFMQQATLDAMYNVYDPTAVRVIRAADNTDADVRVHQGSYGMNGALAWVNCPAGSAQSGAHPYRRCYDQTLKYNLSYGLTNAYSTASGRKYVAWHEFGHTLGLRHTSNSAGCMYTTINGPFPQSLTQHEVDLISFFY